MEWDWALCLHAPAKDSAYPIRSARFADAPGLEERVRAFWDDGYDEFSELVLLAHRSGCLWETDGARILARVGEAAETPLGEEPLDSEQPEHRLRVLERLERLRLEPQTRQAWLRLIADVAAALAARWEDEGMAFVDQAVQSLQGEAERATDWTDFKRLGFKGCWEKDERKLPTLCDGAVRAGGEVVVVPSWVGGKGLLLSFGDLVILSKHPSQPTPPSDATRETAKRLRALADPTRLGLVEQLSHHPRSVGELARDFRLAQPTISNHVRVLRDAGLVQVGARGTDRRLVVDAAATQALMDEVRSRLPAPSPAGSEGTSLAQPRRHRIDPGG